MTINKMADLERHLDVFLNSANLLQYSLIQIDFEYMGQNTPLICVSNVFYCIVENVLFFLSIMSIKGVNS